MELYLLGPTSTFDEDIDNVLLWMKVTNGNDYTQLDLITLCEHYRSRLLKLWSATKEWLLNKEWKKDFDLSRDDKYGVIKSIFKVSEYYYDRVEEYEQAILEKIDTFVANSIDSNRFDYHIIQLIIDVSSISCGTFETEGITQISNCKDYKDFAPQVGECPTAILEHVENYRITSDKTGPKYYILLSETGAFAFNTWLYSYLNGIWILGVPYRKSNADGDILCPGLFFVHDIQHEDLDFGRKWANKTQIYRNIMLDENLSVKQKELLLLALWIFIHEAPSRQIEAIVDNLEDAIINRGWDWIYDMIYPTIVTYYPEHDITYNDWFLFYKERIDDTYGNDIKSTQGKDSQDFLAHVMAVFAMIATIFIEYTGR